MATPKDFTENAGSETQPLLRSQVEPVPSESETSHGYDEYVSGLQQQNGSRRRQLSTSQSPATPSSIQASDDTASDGRVLIPLPCQSSLQTVAQKRPSLTRQLLQEVRDYCNHVNKWKLLLCGALVVAILIFIAAFFISGFIQNKHSDTEVYSGDTILLVGNLDPFWYEEVVVGQVATVNTEQEVRLIKEKCNNLKTYTIDTTFQSPSLNASNPVAILDHQRSFKNYFVSGSVSVTVTATSSSGSDSELYLCWFDNYNMYNQFRMNPTSNVRQQAWQPCTEFCANSQPVSRTVNNVITRPGYYYIGVAQSSPVTLQYTFNLSQEVYNHSDYTTLNCSVIGSEKCSIPLDPVYRIDSQEECILAFDPLLPNEIVGYSHLQVQFISRVLNTFSITFGSILLIAIFIAVVLCIVTFKCGWCYCNN